MVGKRIEVAVGLFVGSSQQWTSEYLTVPEGKTVEEADLADLLYEQLPDYKNEFVAFVIVLNYEPEEGL